MSERHYLSGITGLPSPKKRAGKPVEDSSRDRLINNLLNNPSESLIVKIWQHLSLSGTALTTERGKRLKIVYPGRINDNRGADFRDAVIATNRGLIKGDIEVHVKSSDWQAHRHHQDPVYNRVILHVVMWDNIKAATNLQNGRDIRTLVLDKYINSPISRWLDRIEPPTAPNMPCLKAPRHLTADIMAESLDSAGEERFLAKAAKFQADLAQIEASQSLYQGIMGALGYSRNSLPFLELARRVPLQVLESSAASSLPDEEYLARQQALLLGTAGLLPSQRQSRHRENRLDDKWIDKLERQWASSPDSKVMPPNTWQLFRVRPNNSPIRRLAAMSYIILRYRRKGIFRELVDLMEEEPARQDCHRLQKGLVVTGNGYWARRFDFSSGSQIKNQALIGSRRAADIVVNVLLPFTLAWSRVTSQPELERKAIDLYHRYPKLAANSVERHMRHQLSLGSSLVNSARRQQGLTHIYNTLCTQGRCNCCPLAQLEAGNDI